MITILAIVGFIAAATTTAAPLTTISIFILISKQQQNFIAELKSRMVVPSTSSNALGTAYFQFELESNKINYNLTASDLDSVKAAHIHTGKEGANGPVVVTLYKPFVGTGQLGRILSVRDDITSDILEGPLAGKQLSDLVKLMNNRMTYVDIHSYEYPNGELRGQISNRPLLAVEG